MKASPDPESKVFIPAFLQQNLAEFGVDGVEWVASLPGRIAELEGAWDMRVGPAFDHGGAVSWVAPAELDDGSQAVLKIGIPHGESRFESDALRFWADHGAVRVLRASEDGFSILLERCIPGTDLWLLDEEQGDAVAGRMLARMWAEVGPDAPFLRLPEFVAPWWEKSAELAAVYGEEIVAEAAELSGMLIGSQTQEVLLHGDFHPGNVLAAQREPWLFIDPKPVVGDPAFDLAQWLYNRARFTVGKPDAEQAMRRMVLRFANELSLDPARIAGWAFVKSVGWRCEEEIVKLFRLISDV